MSILSILSILCNAKISVLGKGCFNHPLFSGDAASNDVGGLFNQGLLRKAVQKDYQEETVKQKDYQEEAAISSQIGTDYNFSNDGCKI